MKRTILYSSILLTFFLPTSFAVTKRFVNSATGQACPSQHQTIQGAIDVAVDDDIVYVCNSGTAYNEQVTISKNITLVGQNGATIQPSNMTANTTSLVSGAQIAAAILVDGTSHVVIKNLIIDGALNGIGDCSTDPIGVFYRNSSGTVGYTVIRNFTLPGALVGCQTGVGLFVQSGDGGTSSVTAYANSVRNFGKGGIVGNEADTILIASSNVVEGIGPTPDVAQNGIQIGFGASGNVVSNTVNNVVYSSCTDAANCSAFSMGILLYQPSGTATAIGNKVNTTQTGIYVQDSASSIIQSNLISNTLVWDGIAVSHSVPTTEPSDIMQNTITNSGESGVWVSGTTYSVTNNLINEAPVGIIFATDTSNSQSANRFYNTPVNVQLPASPLAAARVSRIRMMWEERK